MKPWESLRYKVSPYNYVPEVRDGLHFREPMVIQDVTILKMDHLAGSRLYAPSEYLEVARLLEAAGIQETIFLVGLYPGTPKDDSVWAGLRAVGGAGARMRIRANLFFVSLDQARRTIDRLVDHGATGVSLVDRQVSIWGAAGLSADQRAQLPRTIDYAKKKGLSVVVNGGYGPMVDLRTFTDQRNEYLEAGADALQVGDPKGYASPEATKHFVGKLRAGLIRDVPLYYHAHDGFGLATALALAAASAGAYPQGSASGIGDQGFASLEEIVMSLELLYSVRTGIRLDVLPELCRTVERITGIQTPPFKAIVGEHINMPEYAIRYLDVLEGKGFLELNLLPYDLDLVGRAPRLMMYYGLLEDRVIRARLGALGLPVDDTAVRTVKGALKRELDALGNQYPVMLSDAQVGEISRRALRSTTA